MIHDDHFLKERIYFKLVSGKKYVAVGDDIPVYFVGDVVRFGVLVDHQLVDNEYMVVKSLGLVDKSNVKVRRLDQSDQ